MAIATPAFTGFRPEAIDFLAELAQNNDRAWFQPRKAEYERAAQGADGGARRRAGRAVRRRAASRCAPTRSARSSGSTATPGSPRTSRRTRRTSVPASRGSTRRGPGSRPRRVRTPTAATSTSSPARLPGRRHVDGRRSPGSMPSGGRSSTSRTGSGRRSRSPGSSQRSGRSQPRAAQARAARACPRTTRWPTCSATRTSSSGGSLSDDEVRSPALPDILADGYAAAMPVFRFLRSTVRARPATGGAASGSSARSGSSGPTGRTCATPASRSSSRLGLALARRSPAGRRGRPADAKLEGWATLAARRRPDRARPRSACSSAPTRSATRA